MDETNNLKELATQLFSELAPKEVGEIDKLFEYWKTVLPKKQEINFASAMPPTMREAILKDIGFEDVKPDFSQSRLLGYLHILNRLMERNIEELVHSSQDELITIVWQEGKKLNLRDSEIQELASVIPLWIQKISNKVIFEFSPINILEMTQASAKSQTGKATSAKFSGIIGLSEKMQSIFSCLEKISASNLSVLIQGESGTGKELVAHAIHANSQRAKENFIPVNCGALPDSIIESELFGHEKGAFTGAIGQKSGYFEIANKGTIFLDEISETSLGFQVKLLRVLQERKVRRVGGTKPVDVDIRIISATNRDLALLVREGGFRHDLYYRVNEMTITIPPLRERKADLSLLTDHFLEKFAKENCKPVPKISPAAKRVLFSYSWPGNIRELENVLKRAVVLADSAILPSHLPQNLFESREIAPKKGEGSLEDQLMAAEREIIVRSLENNSNNVSVTAKFLKVSRRTLQRKMKFLGIDRNEDSD
ncbi:MAG: sigma-54-dependent Fis family transcriptional regulator [Candidatus Riflebacteria bacterium]|nr:sigma-54-dependent Fis family transcriptional regulator [Candidatus Riflebacteria bacterium]